MINTKIIPYDKRYNINQHFSELIQQFDNPGNHLKIV